MRFIDMKMPVKVALRALSGLFVVLAFWLLPHHVAYAMTCTFTGVVDTDWQTPGNWDCAAVPTSTTDVVIPAAASVSLSSDADANDVTIGAATVDFGMSNNFLHVYGNWVDSGIMTGNGIVVFIGPNPVTIGATNDFYQVRIQKSGGALATLIGSIVIQQDVAFFSDLDLAGNFLAVQGNLNDYGASLTDSVGTGDIFFTGAFDSHVYLTSLDFINLYIQKTGASVILDTDATTTQAVHLVSGTFNLQSMNLHVGGDWTNTGGTLQASNHGVAFNGAGPSNVSGQGYFNDITIDKTGGATTTIDTDLQINNAIWLKGGVFDMNGHIVTSAYGVSSLGGSFADSGTLRLAGGVGASLDYPSVIPNLTIDYGTAYVTLNAMVTTTHNLIFDSGYLRLNGQTLHVGGNWTDNGGTLLPGSGVVDFYNGLDDQYISAEDNFGAITITKVANGVFLNGDINVHGTLSLTGGGILNVQGQNMVVTSSTNIGAGTTVTSTSGTITLRDSVNLSGSLGTASGNFALDSLTVNGTGQFDLGSGTATTTGVLTNNGVINDEAGILAIDDDIAGAGTHNPGTGTLRFYGGNDQDISGFGPFNNFDSIKTAGTISAAGNLNLSGWLHMRGSGGALNNGGNDLLVNGSATIAAGNMVTSTTGTINVGSMDNSGDLGTVSGNLNFGSDLTVESGGTFDLGAGTATTTDFTLAGTMNAGTGRMNVQGDMTVTASGTLDAGTSAFVFNASVGSQVLNHVNPLVFYDVREEGSQAAIFYTDGITVHDLYVAGAADGLTVYGLTVNGDATNTTRFYIDQNTSIINGTLDNSGFLFMENSGVLVLDGPFINSGGVDTSGIGSGNTLHINNTLTNSGTLSAGTAGTVVFGGVVAQAIPATWVFGHLTIDKTNPGDTVTLTADATVGGNLNLQEGTFVLGANTLHVGGDLARSGGTLNAGTGTVDFNGGVAQSLASGGNLSLYDLTLNKAAGTLTLSGNVTSTHDVTITTGTLALGSYTLNVGHDWSNAGTFTPDTGTVMFNGTGAQAIDADQTFYDLSLNKTAGTLALNGNATATHAFTNAAGTFAVGANIFYAPATYINNGLVTRTTGKIRHAAESKNFTDSGWVTQGGYTVPTHFYLQVQDANRNMDGSVAETISVPVTTTGGDSETIALTETGAATGIFRSGAIGLFSGTPHPGSGAIEISSNSVGTETYTDNQDTSDSGSTTATLTYSGGGGGGGGGSGYLPSPVTTYQSQASDADRAANLANLAKLNIAIHSLVKLADDGDTATQEDSAVYYIGASGKRHAFPNSKVYFSWYTDFSGVKVISAADLASIPLGANVRYKPGSRMVKFTTDPKVYAVDINGKLRWVKTEATAKALYGDKWNTMIDDMSDAFFGSYAFGDDINSTADFDPNKTLTLEQYISDDLAL